MVRNFTAGLLLLLSACVYASAQDRPDSRPATPSPAVTFSVSANGVRFVAFGSGVRQIRLEVFGAGDAPLYNSDLRAGNILDWRLEDGKGARLPDGSYLCVVTFRDVSGRLGVKQGTVLVQAGEPSMQMGEGERSGSIEPETAVSPLSNEATGATTLTAHDGDYGQVVSTHGGLSFRSGDFFSGRDRELMRVTPDGRVGIGTDKPETTLDVAGTIRARGGIKFEDGSVLRSAARVPSGLAGQSVNAASGDITTLSVSGAGTANQLAKWADNLGTLGNSSIIEANGRVGIGTATPTAGALLDVRGNLSVDGSVPPAHAASNYSSLWLKNNVSLIPEVASGYSVVNLSTNFQRSGGTWTNVITGLPAWTFSMGAGPGYDQFSLTRSPPGTYTPSQLFVINSAGNVGIGNASPGAKLHIGAGTAQTYITIDGSAGASYNGMAINTAGTQKWYLGRDGSDGTDDFILKANSTSNVIRAFSPGAVTNTLVLNAGKVGIGTANPLVKLDVVGDIKVSGDAVINGNIAAKYQDVAEWVPASEKMRAGTVVTLDVTRTNAVEPCSRAYDTRVAGVVSAQPGLILGEGGAGKVLVATTGRVKVRVDATRRPVRVGDLLVTSGRPGVAMRSVPVAAGRARIHRPGTIIGKALEPLAGGEGEILVLLSLQ